MTSMRAMMLDQPRQLLRSRIVPGPVPGCGELLLEVSTCGICRGHLHVVDRELTEPSLPLTKAALAALREGRFQGAGVLLCR